MTRFEGFRKKEEAERFIKENGRGLLTSKTDKDTELSYQQAVIFGGLNEEEYPYCVQWND